MANSLLTKLLTQCGRKIGAGLAFSRALQKGRSNEMQSHAKRLWLSQQRAVLRLNAVRANSLPGAVTQTGSMEMLPAPALASSMLWGSPPQYCCIDAHPEQFSQLLWWYLGQTTFAKPQVHPQSAHRSAILTVAGTAYVRGKGLCILTHREESRLISD